MTRPVRPGRLRWAAAVLLGLAGCSAGGPPAPGPSAPASAGTGERPAPAPSAAAPGPSSTAPGPSSAGPAPRLPPVPTTVRTWSDYQVRAAHRLLVANPTGTYSGRPQDVLLAIPVLEIEVNADGSVRRIGVLRRPGQAPETVQLAMEAVRRAAPFGDVRHLPRPWKFNETFLFNDDRRFKPRSLDGG